MCSRLSLLLKPLRVWVELVVVTPRGTKIWHHDFKEIPWEDTGHVTSGMAGLYSEKFTSIDHADLLVTVHWGTGHGGINHFCCVVPMEPKSGTVLRVVRPPYGTRGCGGCWMNVYDYDTDGLEDILYNHHDLIYVLKGTDGTLLLNKYVGDMFGDWTANGRTYVAVQLPMDNGKCCTAFGRRICTSRS